MDSPAVRSTAPSLSGTGASITNRTPALSGAMRAGAELVKTEEVARITTSSAIFHQATLKPGLGGRGRIDAVLVQSSGLEEIRLGPQPLERRLGERPDEGVTIAAQLASQRHQPGLRRARGA